MSSVMIELLGPLRVVIDGQPGEIRSAAQGLILSALALAAGASVSSDRLVEVVWEDAPPADPKASLQVAVSKLRSIVGRDTIVTGGGGYRLAPDVGTDVMKVEALLVEAGKDGLQRALACWRGEALAEVSEGSPLGAERVRLRALRLRVQRGLLEERLRSEDPDDLVPELAAAVSEDPFNERLAMLHIEALLRAGRQAEAANAAAAFRKALLETTGLVPGTEFDAVEQMVLTVGTSRSSWAQGVMLPAPPVLLGRDEALVRLEELVKVSPVTTVVGPGGVGKTSLVAVWSQGHEDVAVAGLHQLSSGDDVVASIARQIGLSGRSPDVYQALLDHMAAVKPILLIDNCEHVLDAVRRLATDIRMSAPHARLVCTSRQRLGIHSEQVMHLGPFPVPAESEPPGDLRTADAVRLFLDRAHQADPDVVVNDEQLSQVVAICGALEGLPLAIELAAARMPIFGLDELSRRVERDIAVLEQGGGRHRSLSAVIDWSIGLLDDEARRVLETAAVFDAGFALDDLEEVHGGTGVTGALGRLVEASLVARGPGTGRARFRLHVPTRLYVSGTSSRPEELDRRFIAWGKHVVAGVAAGAGFPGETQALARARDDIANICGAVRTAIRLGDREAAFEIAADLGALAYVAGDIEVYSVLHLVVDSFRPGYGEVAIGALAAAARAASMQGRWDQAKQRATDAEELIIGEPPPVFHMAEHALAVVDYYAGDYAGAERHYATVVADDRVALPWRLMADMERGSAVARGGNVSSGRAITAAALARAEAEAGETVVAWGSYVLGSIDLVDEPARALEAFDRAIAKARDSQTVLVEQFAGVGRIAALIGCDRHGEAASVVPSVLDSLVRHGNRTHLWSLARLVCLIAIENGDVESAALLAGAMEYDAAAPLASSIVAATSELEELANRLGEAGWADARRRAEAMDLRQVTALMRTVAENYAAGQTRDTKP